MVLLIYYCYYHNRVPIHVSLSLSLSDFLVVDPTLLSQAQSSQHSWLLYSKLWLLSNGNCTMSS